MPIIYSRKHLTAEHMFISVGRSVQAIKRMSKFAKSCAERKRDERARKKMKAAINCGFKAQYTKEQALENRRVENGEKKIR